jgi:hypothetical protein
MKSPRSLAVLPPGKQALTPIVYDAGRLMKSPRSLAILPPGKQGPYTHCIGGR